MSTRAYLLLPVLVTAAACGGSESSRDTSIPGAAIDSSIRLQLPSDEQILALVYDDLYTVPEGFFVDERAGTERSYTVHHVLDDSRSYEVCTDDFAVAMALEDADNASRSVQGYFVESYENARYFEFVRELSYNDGIGNIDDLTSPGFARVFKCSNTNRDGVDRMLLDGYAGMLNARPIDANSVREFAEYLWQFAFFPNSRRKVIGTRSEADDGGLHHVLQLAFATSQGPQACDRIEVAEWRFSVDLQTGSVERSFQVVHSLDATLQDGSPVTCD